MEIKVFDLAKNKLSKSVLNKAMPFTKKRDVNWKGVKIISGSFLLLLVVTLLVFPVKEKEAGSFSEIKVASNSEATTAAFENNPTQETVALLNSSQSNRANASGSVDYLYKDNSQNRGGGHGSSNDKNASMIVGRSETDSRLQLLSGSRITIRLQDKLIITSASIPIIAEVTKDVLSNDEVAIYQGAKILGEATFDESRERANINFKSVVFPDGRERSISAIGMSGDGEIGIEGNVHSDSMKNSVGKTISRFVGGYAEGSMNKGEFGANQGGVGNGLKNAIALSAKDETDNFAENLKKEKKWIELEKDKIIVAILTQPFLFTDPGATYGR